MKNKKSHHLIFSFSILLLFFSTLLHADGRIAVRGENGAVASSSLTASKVGIEILKDGGNVDYVGASAVELIGAGESAGNYREILVSGGKNTTARFR